MYLLFIISPLMFMIWVQLRVSSACKECSVVTNMNGMTGAQAGRRSLPISPFCIAWA
ncbi:MAG: zinc metallopeptidase [Chloroflexi bacterium]|nr:zinc metallopeptidase [Chloroflexota bacterium]